MKTNELMFCIASDAYEAGHTEDGRSYTAEMYYIIAEDRDGNRWRHDVNFRGCRVSRDCEGIDRFEDTRAVASTRATILLCKINESVTDLNMSHWQEVRPAYGSVAYQHYGAHEDWMQEQSEG
jgi:hypothetical protein